LKRGLPIVVTFRLVLTGLLLVAAPGAALAHLLLHWAPLRVAVSRGRADVEHDAQAIETAQAQIVIVQTHRTRLDQTRTQRDAAAAPWLPQRDRDRVFDQIAAAFRDPRVFVDRLTLDDPGLYAAASRDNLLACERAVVDCRGSYEVLAECLDRLMGQNLPLRVDRLAWTASGMQLRLTANLEVPFVPDAKLAARLATAANLKESEGPDAP
jgi:hypothetical protein